jgi:D-alanyl-lipoteichoic acid acyltransferase DltB (MBOAT superfamily)
MYVLEGVVYGDGNSLTRVIGGRTLGIPALGQLVKQGAEAPLAASWVSIYCELVKQVLRHAAGGHVIIGVLRLFGFNVFRNTYKPLLAESVVEFWNRYYYYFKELMVTFFFLPTYAALGRRLGKWPQLRLFAAVFAAAFAGNVYYHLIKVGERMAEGRVLEELFEHRSRIFYCFLLALGIFVSMLRQQRLRGQPPAAGTANRILRIAGVWTFFSLIFIWNVRGRATFGNRLDFFLGMFGLA